eukprot:973062-Rhodomonas_salina.1
MVVPSPAAQAAAAARPLAADSEADPRSGPSNPRLLVSARRPYQLKHGREPGWRVEGKGWRMEGKVEGGGWRVNDSARVKGGGPER